MYQRHYRDIVEGITGTRYGMCCLVRASPADAWMVAVVGCGTMMPVTAPGFLPRAALVVALLADGCCGQSGYHMAMAVTAAVVRRVKNRCQHGLFFASRVAFVVLLLCGWVCPGWLRFQGQSITQQYFHRRYDNSTNIVSVLISKSKKYLREQLLRLSFYFFHAPVICTSEYHMICDII